MEFINSILDGSAATTTTLIVIGCIGGILLLFSFFLDGIFELGDGILSLTTISSFVTIFAFSTLVAHGNGVPISGAAAIGAVAGVICAIGSWALSNFFKKDQSSVSISVDSLEGREAIVILPIVAGRVGEIAFSAHGIRHTFTAKSDEEIPMGAKVVILATLSSSAVLVKKVESAENTETLNK